MRITDAAIERGELREAASNGVESARKALHIDRYARALRIAPGSILNERACSALVRAHYNAITAAEWLYECDEAHEPGSGLCPFCQPKEAPDA